jgi:hypothetical protein
MNVNVNGRHFVASYFPFFRTEQGNDFDLWSIRFVDGSISDMTILVFEPNNAISELHENARWLIDEFILEEDEALTPKAQRLKQNLMEIFHEQRS